MFAPTQTIRVGMIGCGGNARGHMRRLLGMENVEIVALSDIADAAVKATRELDPRLEDVPVFSDHEQMLLEAELDGRDYLLGDRFTVADLNVASVLAWAAAAPKLREDHPRVRAWLKRCLGRPAQQKVMEMARAERAA